MRPPLSLLALATVLVVITSVSAVTPYGSLDAMGRQTPLAAFTYEPCYLCMIIGNAISFDASWSLSLSGPIVLYRWDFGDGTPIHETADPRTGHLYGAGPTWLVTLTVKDSKGLSDTISQLVAWGAVPRFSFQPTTPIMRQLVIFDGSASQVISNQDTTPKFAWSFGDGGTGAGIIVTHAFSNPGLYRIVLTYSTVYGDAQASKTIRVLAGGGGGCIRCHPL